MFTRSVSSPYDPVRDGIPWGVALSLLMHGVLIYLLTRPVVWPEAEHPLIIDVSIVPPNPSREVKEEPKSVEKQIVSPPVERKEATESERRFQSDKDNTVQREQIRRGVESAHPGKPGESSKESIQAPKQLKQMEPATKSSSEKPVIKDLTLDEATLYEKFAKNQPSQDRQSKNRSFNMSAYRAFSRPSGSGASFMGSEGTQDFLPNLPDGDITLLNTKANQFAVFVRRVATQVFSQIRLQGWDYLQSGDIASIENFSTVRAILSPKGKLLKVTIEGNSGSARFDDVILKAAQVGALDPNPPKGAEAADGNIYFVFKAKSWSQGAVNGRNGAPYERRWLLLSTGLE